MILGSLYTCCSSSPKTDLLSADSGMPMVLIPVRWLAPRQIVDDILAVIIDNE